MAKYRKKPVVVEAWKYNVDSSGMPDWAAKALLDGAMTYESNTLYFDGGELFIDTLEGQMHVSEGDYIIKGINGELYPCKPDIFEKTYEVALT